MRFYDFVSELLRNIVTTTTTKKKGKKACLFLKLKKVKNKQSCMLTLTVCHGCYSHLYLH